MKNLLVVLLSCLLPGCAAMHRPQTTLSYSPLLGFGFKDTKDNDVSIKNLKVDPTSKAVEVEELTLRNNASDPINAWVNQMKAQTELNKVTIESLNSVVQTLVTMIPNLPPVIKAVKGTDVPPPAPAPTPVGELKIDPTKVLVPPTR